MAKKKEGFKGERFIYLPEELLLEYRKDPLIGNLYVRKIGFFPKVEFHYVEKEEGTDYAMLIHCVYTNEYYNQDNTLILSARIDGKRIETVELSLDTFKVVQSRGVCNSNTEYHDRIINLVESNAELIRQRMNKAA